jgi:hypothetical protein
LIYPHFLRLEFLHFNLILVSFSLHGTPSDQFTAPEIIQLVFPDGQPRQDRAFQYVIQLFDSSL